MEKRRAAGAPRTDTFELIATEWLELQRKALAPETMQILGTRLKGLLYPYIGSRPVRSLAPVKSRNFASVTDPQRVGELLRVIDGYDGQPITALALKLAPLVFVRPGELGGAEWCEFDLENAVWRIRGSRMKMSEQHRAPFSAGGRHPPRTSGAHRQPSVRLSATPQSRSAHVGEHDKCRAAAARLLRRRADGSRFSKHGEHTAQLSRGILRMLLSCSLRIRNAIRSGPLITGRRDCRKGGR